MASRLDNPLDLFVSPPKILRLVPIVDASGVSALKTLIFWALYKGFDITVLGMDNTPNSLVNSIACLA